MTSLTARTLLLCATLLAAGCDYFVGAESRYERARGFAAEGDHRRAVLELRNALEDDPGLHGARLQLAESALWLGDPRVAEREVGKVPADFEPQRAAEIAVRVDLANGRHQKVIERLSRDSPLQPERISLYLGHAELALGQPARAEEHYRAAHAADATLLAADIGIAEARAAQDDLSGALALTAAAKAASSDSALAWFVHGALLARRGALGEASVNLQRASELSARQLDVPTRVALGAALIEVRIANRELEAASDAVGSLNRLVPGSPVATLMTARVAMARNDFATATNELRRLTLAAPQLERGRFLLAVSLTAQGNLEQASSELAQVLEQAPQNLQARELLAQLRVRLNDPDGALRVLVPALDSSGNLDRVNALFHAVGGANDKVAIGVLERELMKTPGNLALRRQLASSYLQAQAPAKALDVLTKVDGATLDADAVRLLIAASREAETERATRARVDALLESRREHHEIVAFLAQYLAATGELDAARRVLARAIETAPDDPALRLASAEIALSLGDRAGAASQLEAVRRADPKAVHARLLLARMALDRDDAKAAEALVTEALASAPAVAPARNAAGLLYLTTARYDDAAAHFRAGTVAEPANALLWLNLGRAQLGLGQSDAARNSLLQALQFNPRWLPAEGALAFLELDEGHPGAALARIAALREADPKNADVLMLEGELLGALRRYADAERAFQAAAALRPSALAALRIYQVRAAGQQPNAAEPLQSWVRAQPEDLGMRMALAQAHASAGQRKLAAEQYEYIVARAPRDVTSLNNLAWLYFELKDPRSLELARKAHALAPDAAAVADTLGWILVQSGRQAEGLGVLERAASTGAGGDVEYHYAFALARSGRQAEAVTRLRRLLEAPDSFSSREEASRLLASLDK